MASQEVLIGESDVQIGVLPGLGARLNRLRVDDNDLLRTPTDIDAYTAEPFFWGGFVMAPWCNRVSPGPLEVAGRRLDLQPNFRDRTVIHGQVYSAVWHQDSDTSFSIEGGGEGWPWRYRVETTYRVAGRRLEINQRLRNLDDAPMPGGIGLHPWFTGQPELVINSALVYPSNTDPIPVPEPVTGDLDMRRRRRLAVGVDSAWADVRPPQVELWWPDAGLHATLLATSPMPHIVAANLAEIDAIALEPQTHAPQGIRRLLNGEPGALQLIDPDDVLEQRIVLEFDVA